MKLKRKLLIIVIINILLLQNKVTTKRLAVGLAQANLASKSDIANLTSEMDFDEKLKNLSKKVTSNKTKHLLVKN